MSMSLSKLGGSIGGGVVAASLSHPMDTIKVREASFFSSTRVGAVSLFDRLAISEMHVCKDTNYYSYTRFEALSWLFSYACSPPSSSSFCVLKFAPIHDCPLDLHARRRERRQVRKLDANRVHASERRRPRAVLPGLVVAHRPHVLRARDHVRVQRAHFAAAVPRPLQLKRRQYL